MNVSNSINKVVTNAPVNKLSANKPVHREVPVDAPRQLPVTDRVELSGMSHLLKTLKAGGDIRADKVEAIKKQLEAGTYEDDHKLDVAADRLLDDLLK